jgi:hypothetical protein
MRSNRMLLVSAELPGHDTLSVDVAALFLGSGTLAVLAELGLNPSFAMLFLRPQNLAHQRGLAGLVRHVRTMVWFPAGGPLGKSVHNLEPP